MPIADDLESKAVDISHEWTSAWSQKDVSVWLNIYAPNATYINYAFSFRRRGHAGLNQHFHFWRAGIPEFRMEVSEVWPAKRLGDGRLKCSIRTHNIGTFENDLPSVKASGKAFNYYGVVDITWDEANGLIEEIEEWYPRQFDSEKLFEPDA